MEIISIDVEQLDYLEGLWYQSEGYKQLVRFLSTQDRTNDNLINEFTSKYIEIFTMYNIALNEVCNLYAKSYVNNGSIIVPDFRRGALIINDKRCNCDKVSVG